MRRAIWGASLGLVLSIAATGLLLTECSDNNPGTAGDGGNAGCPTNPPTPGTTCTLPNGTMCNQYPQPGCACCSGGGGYECNDGKWQELGVANGVQPGIACPATVPEAGSFCSSSPCGGAQPACSYDCATGNGFVSSATCENGSWSVTQLEIACEVDAGVDAGADAGDGG